MDRDPRAKKHPTSSKQMKGMMQQHSFQHLSKQNFTFFGKVACVYDTISATLLRFLKPPNTLNFLKHELKKKNIKTK